MSRHRDETGFALIVVLMLMALLLSLGAVAANTSRIELQIAGNDLHGRQALEVADAGIEHALAALRLESAGRNGASDGFDDELTSSGTGGALAALGTIAMLADGNLYRCAKLSGQSGDDGYCVRMADNDDETTGTDDPTTDADDTVRLISRGSVGRAERIVEARIRRAPVYPCVVCSSQDFPTVPGEIALLPGFSSDSYDSRAAPYDPATAGTNGHMLSNGDVTLSGAPGLPVDVAGDITATGAIQTVSPPTNVAGDVDQFVVATRFVPVLPCGPPFPSSQPISGGAYDPATGTLANVSANEVIELAGGPSGAPTEYCFSSIQMSGNSSLRANGSVHIRLTQPSTILGLINASGRPADLRISSSVNQPPPIAPAGPGLTLGGAGGQLVAAVDAPNAQIAFAGAPTDFFGQLVSGVPPPAGLSARFHYDEALDAPEIFRTGWRELRNHPPS